MVMQKNKKKMRAPPFLELLSSLTVIRVFLEPKKSEVQGSVGFNFGKTESTSNGTSMFGA